MNRIFQIITLVFVLLGGITPVHAQDNGVVSPYSRYGVGLLGNQFQGFNQGMAGLGYGMRGGRELNYKNPASYSAIDSLNFIFDMGVTLQSGNFDDGVNRGNVRDVTFDYLSVGFRIRRGLGMSLGLMPFSSIGYKLTALGESYDMGSSGTIASTSSNSGTGGLHVAYAGIGYSPVRSLSFGLNAGYMWGVMTHVATNSFTDTNVSGVNRAYSTDIRTYELNAGLQWVQPIGKKNRLVLGLTYGLGHDIASDSYFYNQRIGSSVVLASDTLVARDAWSLPHRFGGGLTWEHGKSLRIGVDYSQQQWSQAKQPVYTSNRPSGEQYHAEKTGYEDVSRITIGAEYVKNPDGLTWASRVRYRAGFSYGNNYTQVSNSDAPRSYMATIGAALPIINRYNNRTYVNVGGQYECVKPKVAGQVTERYFRLYLGITFNERWFQKWKVE